MARQREERRIRFISLSAAALCFLIITGIGFAMPGIMARLSGGEYENAGMMASIFCEGNALGYVLIGILAFALGVCLTVLCYILRRRNNSEDDHD